MAADEEDPIDDISDLHTFRPQEIADLLEDCLKVCHARGICQVRVIHGKCIGPLKRRTLALLSRMEMVAPFRQALEDGGGWGATPVWLQRRLICFIILS